MVEIGLMVEAIADPFPFVDQGTGGACLMPSGGPQTSIGCRR